MSVWFKNIRTGVEWEISDADMIKRLDERHDFCRVTREAAPHEPDAPVEPEAPPEPAPEPPKTPGRKAKSAR